LWERSGENDNDEINVQACPTCTNNQNGQFSFTNSRANGTGLAVANAALGFTTRTPKSAPRLHHISAPICGRFRSGYLETNAFLTLTYGARYNRHRSYHAEWRNMAVFDPRFYDQNNAVTIDHIPPYRWHTHHRPRYNGMVIRERLPIFCQRARA